ncbi:tetratricopeptide repeat-containing sensor histidine kinase [Puia sp.]|jgi:tetratricopeptide (TPR) repeat protein|uniref:tetratricopeptide repeat-containing sensor histidine kinase n=1 Tax=Puia sp. TaxID=2045100 RepID=UPI002F40D320
MRTIGFILLLSLLAGVDRSWATGSPEETRRHVDSLLEKAIRIVQVKKHWPGDSLARYADEALRDSRSIGYAHGIALSLACQAFIENMTINDFARSEQLGRESLAWFDQTEDKRGVTIAHYILGFSLFAQSHFEEANRHFDLAREYARKQGNRVEEIYMLSMTGEAYRESGDYEKAFTVLRQCAQMSEADTLYDLARSQYLTLAGMFVQIENFKEATRYFQLGYGDMKPEQGDLWDLSVYIQLLTREQKYDSALYYFNRFDSAQLPASMMRTFLATKGEYYLYREEYATALPYLLKSLDYQRQLNDNNQIMRCLQDIAKAYYGLGRDTTAFRYAREGLQLSVWTKARQNTRDACRQLYLLFDRQHRTDSAYAYYRRYIVLKDSVLSDWTKGEFASFGYEQQIQLLNKEKQLQEVCLREEMLTKNLLLAGILVILLLGGVYVWIVRLKRRNEAHRRKRAEDELEIERLEGERAKAALQQRAKELEVQALRSQMNPHFIFNCLNAINRFILGHETEAASDYLTKFSRLMRMIMNHSRHSMISLAEEIEMLQLYLEMECLRFKDAFDYRIDVEENLDTEDVRIPPLLIQPFAENAVWHGLMHKEEHGSLTVRLRVNGDVLTCIVQDNGIGRKHAGMLKSKSAEKHKSMGLQITAERMALLNGPGGSQPFFRIEDLYDEKGSPVGTQVTLTIKINQPAGEPEEAIK